NFHVSLESARWILPLKIQDESLLHCYEPGQSVGPPSRCVRDSAPSTSAKARTRDIHHACITCTSCDVCICLAYKGYCPSTYHGNGRCPGPWYSRWQHRHSDRTCHV
ncbi:hypothetical protein P692DRAFT_20952870, partial [Suillus brevipes Sb2]